MPTLVIHAPDYRVKPNVKSFEAIMADGIGDGYAIFQTDKDRLHSGCTVVLLRKDRNRKRAEGRLVKLEEINRKTPQGIQRYDIYFNERKHVPYKAEKLNRYGVAVIS
jgi:hypothetical protein